MLGNGIFLYKALSHAFLITQDISFVSAEENELNRYYWI